MQEYYSRNARFIAERLQIAKDILKTQQIVNEREEVLINSAKKLFKKGYLE